ncbi:SRPBCC family protein [Lacihabitans soyangensis]|uniref:SRPBCC domain-containing protein n=1 Tax=Lacihabitans soyangensis TaxID=869394 RepID=A0AAE3H3E2_9BACT|nr:SRPBCC domain-containing protein [Lacihabitans soyangensis]MCP9763274.1 SRPBCC domain-containing protein [Lacihabitans soyangensis]
MKPDIVISRVFDADISLVWRAITEKELMKEWYFDLEKFEPIVGFRFEFKGGHEDGIQYNHLCEITEVEFEKKLTYSWKYEGYEGLSFVSFELSSENNKTQLDFTHSGLLSFPSSNPDFAVHNFEQGWTHFIDHALPQFLIKNI